MKKGWFVRDVPLKTVIPVTSLVCQKSHVLFHNITDFSTSFLQTWLCVEPYLQLLTSNVRGIGYIVAILSFPSGCPENTRVTKIDFS